MKAKGGAGLTAFVMLVCSVSVSSAQVRARVQHLNSVAVDTTPWHVGLLGQYFRGQVDSVVTAVRTRYSKMGGYPLSEHWVSVAIAATPPTDTQAVVVRLLIPPGDDEVRVLPTKLPGVEKLYEIVIVKNTGAEVATAWLSSRQRNPIEDQAKKAGELAMPVIAQLAEASLNIELLPRDRPAKGPIAVVNEVRLPHERADIQVVTRIKEPALLTRALVEGSATKVQEASERGAPRLSACSQHLADSLLKASKKYAATVADSITLRPAVADSLRAIASHVLTTDSLCKAEAAPSADFDRGVHGIAAAEDLLAKFVAVVSPAVKAVTGTTELPNRPKRLFDLGAYGGGMVSRGGDTNVKITDGVLEEDAVSGLVTAAVFHIHFGKYDADAFSPSRAERLSFMAGLVVTPKPGATVGFAGRVIRGLGVHCSYGWLVVDKPAKGLAPGSDVSGVKKPRRTGVSNVVVVGLTYDFK